MTPQHRPDSWLSRCMMRLTRLERRAMNSPRHARRTVRIAAGLLEQVTLPRQPICLEIGCGQGALARLLVETYNARVVATDYDPAQVVLAQKRLTDLEGEVELRVADARAIPFDDELFDAALSFGVLHHITRGWQRAVAEVARVLKPGGWYVFADLVISPGVRGLMGLVLPRLGLLEEMALQVSLEQQRLDLRYYAYEPVDTVSALGLIRYTTAIARKVGADGAGVAW